MKKIYLAIFMAGIALFYACSDDNNSPVNPVQVKFYLTDAPTQADYKAVWIDVQSIRIATDGENWTDLPITPTKVNLLAFSNGTDTLLSNIMLRSGVKVQQIRLLLGSDNSLELNDNSIHPLGTPSGQTSGLKINVQTVAQVTGSYQVIIDFNAHQSIVAKGNGTYSLKPVVRAFIEANTSSISGELLPNNIPTKVFTMIGQDTVATISDTTRNNYFMLRGLTTGNYQVKIQNLTTEEISVLRADVNVVGGTNVNLGVLQLPSL